ncbi:uncharacterized protein YALI1_D28062g [Yarrowia lipolytica]|uniref:Uncharacterized protein n=1 Tax=Yarrowia lipolytica TaxID=4952 RepID=A0A1D8NFN6_YARLL|nr:hypothetical protein YALI1_D28062g [Yarrowia lipolytica]
MPIVRCNCDIAGLARELKYLSIGCQCVSWPSLLAERGIYSRDEGTAHASAFRMLGSVVGESSHRLGMMY